MKQFFRTLLFEPMNSPATVATLCLCYALWFAIGCYAGMRLERLREIEDVRVGGQP